MYVLCVGMYRSCSTWQYEVLADLLERHVGGLRLGYLTGDEFAAQEIRQEDGCWRVLKSHEEHPRFARALSEGRAVAVYAFRDLRDVVFSMLHKRCVSFDDFLRQGMVHQILANDRFWTAQPRTVIQRYEELVSDAVGSVRQLALHVGVDLAEDEADTVASRFSWHANRKRVTQLYQCLCADGVELSDPTNAQWYDGETLLHWNHMREGCARNWRHLATPPQRLVLGRLGAQWLIAHGYETETSWVTEGGGQPGPGWAARFRTKLRTELKMARGRIACELRCASLRHTRISGWIKQLLGVGSATGTTTLARPYPRAADRIRFDSATTSRSTGRPHHERPGGVLEPTSVTDESRSSSRRLSSGS